MTHRKLSPGKLVIASHNQGKVREIRTLLEPYGIEPVSAGDLNLPEPEETGTTFAENALLKAQAHKVNALSLFFMRPYWQAKHENRAGIVRALKL